MQLLDLPLPVRLGVPTDAGVEGSRRLLLKLLLPRVNLVSWTPILGPAGSWSVSRSVMIDGVDDEEDATED